MNLQESLDLLLAKLNGWLQAIILLVPNLLLAVVIVVVAVFAARMVRKVVRRLMDGVSRVSQVNGLIATTAYLMVLFFGVFAALGQLGLDKTVTSLLAGAGIIGLALGFAFQDIATNFISGILLSIRRPFTEGDIVKSNDFFGTVQSVNLRSTIIETFQGQSVVIPNKEVFQNPLVNFSRHRRRRVDLSCGVAYGDDLEQAKTVALKAVEGLGIHDTGRPLDLYYESFGDSSINYVLRFWVDFSRQTDYLEARSRAIMAIKQAYDESGITIPFPIRTLDFGVVGGEKLNEVLPARFYEKPSSDTESPGA